MWSIDFWVFLACATPAVTFVASYLVSSHDHDLDYPDYYLSNSIAYAPESMIGSFGLGATCVFLLPVLYFRYLFVDHKAPEYATSNMAGFCLGVACSFGVMGVGSVQFPNCQWLHVVCADLTFFGFTLYCLFQTYYLDYAVMKMDPLYKRGWWRIATSCICPIAIVVMFGRMNAHRGTTTGAKDLVAPAAEIALVGGFVLWMTSLYGSMGELHFEFHPVNRNNLAESLLHERGLRPVAVSDVGDDFQKRQSAGDVEVPSAQLDRYKPPINGSAAAGGRRESTQATAV